MLPTGVFSRGRVIAMICAGNIANHVALNERVPKAALCRDADVALVL
jgi:hypothetical protein